MLRREEIPDPRLSLSSSGWRMGTNCNLKGKLDYHQTQTMSIRSRGTWFCNSLTSTTFHPSFRLWSTTLNGLEFHQKILNDSMAVLLWQYDSIVLRVWQPRPGCGCITMTVWKTHSMPSSDGAVRKLGHPEKLLLKSGHPKTRMLPFTPPSGHGSRPCIGLLLCSWILKRYLAL